MARAPKYEHKDDKLNRILTDKVADQVKAAYLDGYTFTEILGGLRRGLWIGETEARLKTEAPEDELRIERSAYAAACAAIPEKEVR